MVSYYHTVSCTLTCLALAGLSKAVASAVYNWLGRLPPTVALDEDEADEEDEEQEDESNEHQGV